MTPLVSALSPREEQVIVLASEDLGDQEIAQALGLALATVAYYRREARRKLGVQSTAAAVAIVVRLRMGVPA